MKPEVVLGELADADAKRDAIHIAVLPVMAGEELWPGDSVLVRYDGDQFVARRVNRDNEKTIGIVDPFLDIGVNPGEHCYICLKPYTITGLRHEWTHPQLEAMVQAKPPQNAEEAARSYIGDMADQIGISFDTLMQGAKEQCEESGDAYIHMGSNEDYKNIDMRQWKKFWSHFHTLTGLEPKDNTDSLRFNCAC